MDNKQAFLSYCPKCGHQGIFENGNEKCPYCNTKELPTEYDWDEWLFGNKYPKNLDEIIFNDYIKSNPLFDEELYNKRVGVEKAQQQATLDMMRMEKQQAQRANVPKCPTCGSTNVERISTAQKAFGFALVGLFSSNLGKTMHCKNCGYKW